MEQMTQIGQLIGTYGVSIVIVILFLWDYIVEKKKLQEDQEIIKNTLLTVDKTSNTIANCLIEIKQTNLNTAKSVEISRKQMGTTDKREHNLLERGK